jgi:chorismate dehydratase
VVSATAVVRPGASAARFSASGVLRLGAVSYLNAEPSVHGLEREPGFLIERDLPSRVAERLHAGEVDLALVPSIEYGFGRYAIVPGVAIASRGKVRSVCLFHREPLDRVRRVAVDTSSRASAGLVRVLLHTRLGRDPEYVPMAPGLDRMLAEADAALLIGDPALVARWAGPPPIDLGHAWCEWTGLPFVFAAWLARTPEIARAAADPLRRAAARGERRLAAIAAAGASELGLPPEVAEDYLRERLSFRFGDAERAAVARFRELWGRL